LCFIVGSNDVEAFAVHIPGSSLVSDLRDMIKQKAPNKLEGIDAHQLRLYQISIPDEGDLAQKVEDAVKASSPLRSTTKLSKLFPEPPEETKYPMMLVSPLHFFF
jgi:hypothetical protein